MNCSKKKARAAAKGGSSGEVCLAGADSAQGVKASLGAAAAAEEPVHTAGKSAAAGEARPSLNTPGEAQNKQSDKKKKRKRKPKESSHQQEDR
ncbi:hypothetical protein cyc_08425, partial [Cyclospora cayetanensis]